MTVNIIHGSYWADDIVNELVSMYFMEAVLLKLQKTMHEHIGIPYESNSCFNDPHRKNYYDFNL